MIAMLLCATVPFLISLVFIPSIIESRLAMSMHSRVEEQLEASALFYAEFFDAKKAEFAARADALALDPALAAEDPGPRLEALLDANDDLRTLAVLDGDLRIERRGPPDRHGENFRARTVERPLPGDRRLAVTFLLPERYLRDREAAAEIALVYQASRRLESDRAQAFYLAYFGILLVAVVLSLGVGLGLSRGVTRRIARLSAATERVASGDLGFQVAVGGDDEIARLIRAFNRMISEVAQARDRIVYLEKVSSWQDLARRLAHEIKNPLTPIRLAVQELRIRARAEDPRLERLVRDVSEVVDEEVAALALLVDEFSRFARLPQVHPARVDLGPFLERFVEAYGKYREGEQLELSGPPAGTHAPLDRVLMRRVLVNLVDNAADAAGNPARIRVGARALDAGRTELFVEDDGPGVDPELSARIFEPYFTTKTTGTGLGLAIVKKIALQHGGDVEVARSTLGGARFSILLPAPSPNLRLDGEDPGDDEALPTDDG